MKDGEIAVAQTPEINMMAQDLKETWCLSFWYLAYGRGFVTFVSFVLEARSIQLFLAINSQ